MTDVVVSIYAPEHVSAGAAASAPGKIVRELVGRRRKVKMMRNSDAHLSDEKLVFFADGEADGRQKAETCQHLAGCWSCRLRMRELDDAIMEFSRLYRAEFAEPLSPPEGPRALLRARLRELASASQAPPALPWPPRHPIRRGMVYVAALLASLIVAWLTASPSERNAIPRPDLTPGAVRYVVAAELCSASLGDNGEVMPTVQRQVFAEYGMPNAEATAYEVDYLITPALGGSDDIRNLWPQPYSGSPWNAYVKDALEDYLRTLVCSGRLELATAQHEIAANWVAAYKKYFHTKRPLAAHLRFRSERRPN